MATETLKFVIDAQDNTKAALSSVQSRVAGLNDKIKSLQPTFQKMAIAGGAAFTALAAFGASSVRNAQESIKTQNLLAQVLKSTAGAAGLTAQEINKMATELAKVTNYDDDAIVGGQNLLLTFTKIGKEAFPLATEAMLNMSTAMGTDLKSSAIQIGKALNDPIKGVAALSRVGVQFTDDQQKMIAALVESGDVLGAQKLILKELETQFGGAAKAAADPLTQLRNQMGELSETIGKALLPVITKITTAVQPIIEKIAAWVEANPKLATGVFIAITALTALAAVLGVIGLALPAVIAGLGLLLSPIGLLIAAVIAFGVILATQWENIKLGLQVVWEGIKNIFNAGVEYIKQVLEFFYQVTIGKWIDMFTQLRDTAVEIFDKIQDVVKNAAQKIKDFLQPILDLVNSIIDGIRSAVNAVGDKLGIGKKKSKGVNDAILRPDGSIVRTDPRDYLIATKNPEELVGMAAGTGGNRVVNIYLSGNSFMGKEDVAEQIGDQLVKILQKQMKL